MDSISENVTRKLKFLKNIDFPKSFKLFYKFVENKNVICV